LNPHVVFFYEIKPQWQNEDFCSRRLFFLEIIILFWKIKSLFSLEIIILLRIGSIFLKKIKSLFSISSHFNFFFFFFKKKTMGHSAGGATTSWAFWGGLATTDGLREWPQPPPMRISGWPPCFHFYIYICNLSFFF
jgi:hypothetical protein